MIKKILLALVVLLGGFLAVAAMQPDDYSVTRTAAIAAPPEKVFPLVNNFHNWSGWSPWAKLDPQMKESYSGPESGTGAVYEWTGNSDVGKGKMTITESQPNDSVRINLEFIEPFASTSDTRFAFRPEGAGTQVQWTMSGKSDLMTKAMCLVMGGMDKMIGPDFEKGLAQMKSQAEK